MTFTYCESRQSYVEYSNGDADSVGYPDETEFTVTAAQAASPADWDRRYPGHEITEVRWFPEGELKEAVFYQRTGVDTFSMVTVDQC